MTHEEQPGASAGPERLGGVDLLVLGFPVALCVAHGFSLLLFPSFTPRMALLVAVGIPGLLALAGQARHRDRAALAAVGLLCWIVVAAGFSGAPRLALLGTVGRESSGFIVALVLGVWAVGRRCSSRAVGAMPVAVLIGLGINAFVGLTQVVANVDSGAFAMVDSRATGLTPNPVYFGALAAAGAALAASATQFGLFGRSAMVVSFAAAANLSGSRIAVAAGLVVIVGHAALGFNASRRARFFVVPACYLGGVLLGWLLSASAGGRASIDRLGTGGGGGRVDAWGYGLQAIGDRPLFGWGLGRFRAATQGRFSAEFVRTAAVDDLQQPWFDAHNVLIDVAVGLGVVGLTAVLLWATFASLHARGPLVAPLLVFGAVTMLQPAGLAILPLGMLLLGCADSAVGRAPTCREPSTSVLVATLVGTALAGWLLIADLRLSSAVDSWDPVSTEDAAAWFPRDPVVADVVAQVWFGQEQLGPLVQPSVIRWSQQAIDTEPDRPYFRSQFAVRLLTFEEYALAAEQIAAGLELQPWHVRSLLAAYVLGDRTGDTEMKAFAAERLCELDQDLPEC